MKFEFTLKGRDWLGLYLIWLGLSLAPMAMNQMIAHSGGVRPGSVDPASMASTLLVDLILSIVGLFLYVPLFRNFFTHVRLNGVPFGYTGSSPDFVLMYVGNGLLTLITLGIYMPWAIRNVLRHIARHVEYEHDGFRFEGKALGLIEIFFAALVLPVILLCGGLALVIKDVTAFSGWAFPFLFCAYLVFVPFVYFSMKWMTNFRYRNLRIRWDSEAIPSILKILGEVVLSLVTVGIYVPAAHARLFKYFAGKTKISKDDGPTWSLKTTLDVAEAWKLTWSQSLLVIVTFGVYGAWAMPRIMALYADNTSIERS